MDIQNVEPWFLDVQRAAHDLRYGEVYFNATVSNNEISKITANRSKQVRFQKHEEEQKGAKLWVLDILNNFDFDGTTTFSVIHKGLIITQINTFDTVEYKYPPGSKK